MKLPALAANGLFRHLETLPELSGYYMKFHVILLLAYMALCRIEIVERLQYESPGELGKLMGLDRIPEVRCLRNKVSQLSQDEAPQRWAGTLSQEWMEQNSELAGTLYVDGHVRLYHGQLTKLPKRYVTRQRLCLRAETALAAIVREELSHADEAHWRCTPRSAVRGRFAPNPKSKI